MDLWVRGDPLGGESPAATWFDKHSKQRSSGFEIMLQAKHGSGNAARFRSGEADYADPPTTGRRSDGDDRVVKVHEEIVVAEPWGE
jgi:hypothetical protein